MSIFHVLTLKPLPCFRIWRLLGRVGPKEQRGLLWNVASETFAIGFPSKISGTVLAGKFGKFQNQTRLVTIHLTNFPSNYLFFSARCDSVVAKVTLEITGIPQLSNRDVGWPSPTFTAPTRVHVFEVRS